MATLTYLKDLFARSIGESDNTSVDQTGEDMIEDAFIEISSRHPFLCNYKTSDITLASGEAGLPSDFDPAHFMDELIKVYSHNGTEKTEYTRVSIDDLPSHGKDEYVYTIDLENSKLLSNQSGAVKFGYFSIPTLTNGTSFPVPKAITELAAGDYWQNIEEEPDQADKKYGRAESLYNRAVAIDNRNRKSTYIKHYLSNRDMGFN